MSRSGTAVACFLSASLIGLAGCKPPAPPELKPAEPPTVTVAHPVQVEIQPYSEFIGRTAAVNEVEVVPEVTGIIKKIGFEEGKTVKAGDVLYEIDPIPFQAALDTAKASVASGTATFEKAERELKRFGNLASVSALERERAEADRAVAKAQIDTGRAAVAKAEFELSKTKIVAAISGGINKTEKTVGNLVTANVSKLTRIVSIDPIQAYWDVDEKTSLRYRDMLYKDKSVGDPRDSKTPLLCWMRLQNEDKWVRQGKVDYIARDVTRLSATRELRGVFSNENGYITPGDSCRIRTTAGPRKAVIAVPEIAVGSQQTERFVFVVVPGDTSVAPPKVLPRIVKLGEVREGLQIIESGLKATDTIVVNGLLRVRPGAAITPVEEKIVIPPGFE